MHLFLLGGLETEQRGGSFKEGVKQSCNNLYYIQPPTGGKKDKTRHPYLCKQTRNGISAHCPLRDDIISPTAVKEDFIPYPTFLPVGCHHSGITAERSEVIFFKNSIKTSIFIFAKQVYKKMAFYKALYGSQLFVNFWNGSEQVGYEAVVGHLEDGCFWVLVD